MKYYYYKNNLKKIKSKLFRIKGKFNVNYVTKSNILMGSLSGLLSQYNVPSIQFLKELNDRLVMFIDDLPINLKLIIYEGGKFDFNIYGLNLSFLLKSCYYFKNKKLILHFSDIYNIEEKINFIEKKSLRLKKLKKNIIKKLKINYNKNKKLNKLKLKTFINIYDFFLCFKFLIDNTLNNNYVDFIYNKLKMYKIIYSNIKRLNFLPDSRKSVNMLIFFLKNEFKLKNKYIFLFKKENLINFFNIYEE